MLFERDVVIVRLVSVTVVSGLVAASAQAQVGSSSTQAGDAPVATAAVDVSGPRHFVHDVVSDYQHFFSAETARWLGVGGITAFAVHAGDEILRAGVQETQDSVAVNVLTSTPSTAAGQTYGNTSFQIPFAIGWWIVGDVVGSARTAAAGRDLLRAQISATSWTYALKYAVDRTRPNGDARSFPSGHTSSAFATAMVLQQHYGWKLGVPCFAAAAYTSASRVVDDKHWASDVVFGAFLGMVSARTVTVSLRHAKVSLAPWALPGGAGVSVIASRRDR